MKYNDAINIIKNRNSKKLENNTYLLKDGENFVIRLHNTDIIKITPKNHYILDNGGYLTRTTKDRLNKYLPCNIYQETGLWYISGSLYYNGMELNGNGKPVKPKNPNKTEKSKKTLDKSVTKYIKGFIQDIKENGLNDPSGGDCWYCCLGNKEGNLGEITGNYSHILEHIKEGYFVPSFLWNIIKSRGYNEPAFIWHLCKDDGNFAGRELRSYFKKIKHNLI